MSTLVPTRCRATDDQGAREWSLPSSAWPAVVMVWHLMLTHLWPGTDPAAAVDAARRTFTGPISVATTGTRWP